MALSAGLFLPIGIAITSAFAALSCRATPPEVQRTPVLAAKPDEPPAMIVEIDATPPSETTAAREPDSDAGACEPEMAMDHQPGAHDRFRFEAADGRHGFKDRSGKVVIPPRFRFAYEFSPDGVAPVVEEKRFAFIDVTGRVIAEAYPYDNGPDYFIEGRARILRNGTVGFIDRGNRRERIDRSGKALGVLDAGS